MSKILEEFASYCSVVGEPGFGLKSPASENKEIEIQAQCEEILALMDRKSEFFDRFDYSWAAKKESYNLVLEAIWQKNLLEVISEIPPDHRDGHKLGDICIRVLPCPSLNAEAVIRNGYKLICISSSFIRLLQGWGSVLMKLSDIGRVDETKEEKVSLVCRENYLYGQEMERAVRDRWGECREAADVLLDRIVLYGNNDIPEDDYLIRPKEIDKSNGEKLLQIARIERILLQVEMFVAFHELVHLLRHEEDYQNRSEKEELEADHYACSLMMIFQAAQHLGMPPNKLAFDLKSRAQFHLSQDHVSAGYNAPAFLFMVLHTILSIELPLEAQKEGLSMDSPSVDRIKRELSLNNLRMHSFPNVISSFGFDLTSLMTEIMKSKGSIYPSISYENTVQQLDVITIAVRKRMMERFGMIGDLLNIENNLFRRFSSKEEAAVRDPTLNR